MLFEYNDDELYQQEAKAIMAERFLDSHLVLEPRDIYRWLWEGEFGPGTRSKANSMDLLTQDVRIARMHPNAGTLPVWDNLGLAGTLIKVNLVPYADNGCPFKRLLMLAERVRDIKPDAMRFKQDWAFMKTEIIPGMAITLDAMAHFENDVAFHLVPEVDFSEIYKETYGLGYRIVPRELFFQYFPEYDTSAPD
ncbi:MAG: hypothetical protein HY042_09960 [Spirochaetia bacterium]|nr:hypothetical protein [Spirochaetia bacterium]